MSRNGKSVTMRLSPKSKDLLTKLAEADHRSQANYLEVLILAAASRAGIEWKAPRQRGDAKS